jgi:hypothetical protein
MTPTARVVAIPEIASNLAAARAAALTPTKFASDPVWEFEANQTPSSTALPIQNSLRFASFAGSFPPRSLRAVPSAAAA